MRLTLNTPAYLPEITDAPTWECSWCEYVNPRNRLACQECGQTLKSTILILVLDKLHQPQIYQERYLGCTTCKGGYPCKTKQLLAHVLWSDVERT